jgi:hypothetical protein
MSYNNSPVMPNKYLLPDGSITTFAGVEWAAADSDRADTYKQIQWQAAKWLMPDGSIVSAKQGEAYNFSYKNPAFTWNAASYYVAIKPIR